MLLGRSPVSTLPLHPPRLRPIYDSSSPTPLGPSSSHSAMATATAVEPDIAPMTAFETEAIEPATGGPAAGARRHRGLLRRMMMTPRGHNSPIGVDQGTAPGRAPEMAAPMPAPAAENDSGKPRRGWLRRLMSDECVHRGRWKGLSGASRLAGLSRSLRWKRPSTGFSVSLKSGWASALLDTVAFRVMYVVEAVVLVLGLSCFFCCCGCQI